MRDDPALNAEWEILLSYHGQDEEWPDGDDSQELIEWEDEGDDDEPQSAVDFPSQDTVGLYLRETGRVPLLNADEEVKLARAIESGRAASRQLAKQPDHTDADRLRCEAQLGLDARDQLIRANTRLVVSIAKRYMSSRIAFLDLIQEGNIGLMKAVEKYDYRRGYRFSTYATWWIRQTITRAIADQSRTIRMPVHMSDRIRQLQKTARHLEQELGRKPTPDELAQALQLSARKVRWMLRIALEPVSLETPVGDDSESELGHFLPNDAAPMPAQEAEDKMLREQLEELLDTLSPREARVLRLRYGLSNESSHTLEEVGAKFGLTRERIRQIEGRALRRLRHPMRSRHLRDYLF